MSGKENLPLVLGFGALRAGLWRSALLLIVGVVAIRR